METKKYYEGVKDEYANKTMWAQRYERIKPVTLQLPLARILSKVGWNKRRRKRITKAETRFYKYECVSYP